MLGERVTRLEEDVQAELFALHPLDEHLVRSFHQRICGDLTPDWAGKWRDVAVTVGPLIPPAPHLLPVLMRDYALDLQTRWSAASGEDVDLTLEFLAFAEGRFLTIHPFRDFNGRTIRVLLSELLRRLDLPLVNLAPEQDDARATYFAAWRQPIAWTGSPSLKSGKPASPRANNRLFLRLHPSAFIL